MGWEQCIDIGIKVVLGVYAIRAFYEWKSREAFKIVSGEWQQLILEVVNFQQFFHYSIPEVLHSLSHYWQDYLSDPDKPNPEFDAFHLSHGGMDAALGVSQKFNEIWVKYESLCDWKEFNDYDSSLELKSAMVLAHQSMMSFWHRVIEVGHGMSTIQDPEDSRKWWELGGIGSTSLLRVDAEAAELSEIVVRAARELEIHGADEGIDMDVLLGYIERRLRIGLRAYLRSA